MKVILRFSLIFLQILFFFSVMSAQEIFNPELYSFDCQGNMKIGHVEKLYFVYNGQDEDIDTEELIIETEKATTKWEKKKADRNCLSADPNDCLVWCLVAVPAQIETYHLISDTTITNDWHELWINTYEPNEKSEERVLCKDEISEGLLEQLKMKLISRGADLKMDKKYKKLKKDLRKELHYFQKTNNLGIGRLSYETMEFLFKQDEE